MSVSIAVTPASPRATIDHCNITVDEADQNDDAAFDDELYPASPEVRYYISLEESSVEKGRSYVFSPDENGGHVFMNYIFPDAGTWVAHLRLVEDDSSVANSGNITVS